MKVGDLVRYKSKTGIGQRGIIIKLDWSGTAKVWVVEWMNGVRNCYPERYLEAL